MDNFDNLPSPRIRQGNLTEKPSDFWTDTIACAIGARAQDSDEVEGGPLLQNDGESHMLNIPPPPTHLPKKSPSIQIMLIIQGFFSSSCSLHIL